MIKYKAAFMVFQLEVFVYSQIDLHCIINSNCIIVMIFQIF